MEQNFEIFNKTIDYHTFVFGLGDCIVEDDKEKPQNLDIVTSSIEKDLAAMKEMIDDMSKIREKVAKLEADLVMKVNSSTWKEISEFIGLSRATIIEECFKILDQGDSTRPEKK